jgi:hypothetical protein
MSLTTRSLCLPTHTPSVTKLTGSKVLLTKNADFLEILIPHHAAVQYWHIEPTQAN